MTLHLDIEHIDGDGTIAEKITDIVRCLPGVILVESSVTEPESHAS